MRTRCALLFSVALLTLRLQADTREVVRTADHGREYIFAQYVQGHNIRTEDLTPSDPRPSVTIYNSERNTTYRIDLQSRKYVEYGQRSPDLILSLAYWIARPPRIRESGKTVNVYYETIDTGERQQFFGRTARHLRVRQRSIAEPGACQHSFETETDGWYLLSPEPGNAKRSSLFIAYTGLVYDSRLVARLPCQDKIVTHGDARPLGLAVRETTNFGTREITEFSNDPLDKSLFEAPSGFQKIDAFPGEHRETWSERMQMEWAQLERAFESWFD